MTPAERTQRGVEVAVALALGALGAAIAAGAWRLPAGDGSAPGPGFAPLALGIGLALAGIAAGTKALLATPRAPADEEEGAGRKAAFACLLLLGAVLAFEPLGFMLTSLVFLFAGFTLLGGANWRMALPAAAVAAALLWLLFTKLLGVGLPYGLIGEVLFR